ncbi:hypothetical protein KEJ21_05855, partial [Candidatus Bathyarchaeota archaeon]|nr:hypothetical protein [Candidatus Bathyarchaeota archaeon]
GSSLADRFKLPRIGGSDAHFLEAVGRAFTIVETDSVEAEDILKAIKKGNTLVHGRGITILEKIFSKLKFELDSLHNSI